MESALYGIYALVVFVSEILLVRFLIRQQLVLKYRTPPLFMKYSLYTEKCDTHKINVFFFGSSRGLRRRGCFPVASLTLETQCSL